MGYAGVAKRAVNPSFKFPMGDENEQDPRESGPDHRAHSRVIPLDGRGLDVDVENEPFVVGIGALLLPELVLLGGIGPQVVFPGSRPRPGGSDARWPPFID